jgi:hypothetical protein
MSHPGTTRPLTTSWSGIGSEIDRCVYAAVEQLLASPIATLFGVASYYVTLVK